MYLLLSSRTTKRRRRKKKNKQPHQKQKKTTHEIKRTIITVEEVNQYLQHVQSNPDLDEFPMKNPTICTQIAECEVAYYKIRHTNPVLAEVDMEFYHSLPPVQVLLREITRLESLAMKLEATNTKTTTNTTNSTTTTRPKPKIYTETDTMSTTEYNNNKTNDNCTKTDDDKHIAEQALEMKRQQKQAREGEQAWHRNNNKRMRSEANEQETEKE